MLEHTHNALTRLLVSVPFVGLLLVALLAVSPVSANAAYATSSPRTWHAVVGVNSKDYAISGMAFLPHELWINVGDTVVWNSKSAEIHTVTFLKPGQTLPPFNPNDPTQLLPQGGSVYDGVSYYNSGLMIDFPGIPAPGGNSYKLTFGVQGDFTYYCLVHPGMIGIVHVQPAGTPYPYSQWDYNRQINQGTAAIMRDGYKLTDIAKDESNNTHVILGIGDGLTAVMRYFPQHIVIHVGQTITFTNRDPMEPHTVTFGPTAASGDATPYGNPKAFDGSTPLNSGFLGMAPGWFGTTYTVKFVKAGTYAFRCDLHEYMGMVATIVVLPADQE